MTAPTPLTIDQVLAIPAEDRERIYREYRGEAEYQYQCVASRTSHNAAKHADRLRAAGRDHQADSAEREHEERQKSYDDLVHTKFLLAILTGRYDFALREGRPAGSSSDAARSVEITRASAARAAEIGVTIHPPEGQWLSPDEAAALTSTSASSWRNRAAAGKIPGAFKKGKQWLIPRATVTDR